eukprot:TRINITY_DN678_c0_g1_i1.p1 TRINITY_DN678_c0_g1~~TRINITY_DN678_c0_g1_i1.p1  ORF type:complete len:296 (+),score=56.04 TRINITY_DN678_c0_g1_i1:46-888(+)
MTHQLPIDLVIVRHGQSEGNLAQFHSKIGDDSLWTEAFQGRASRNYRLTDVGIAQAKIAGEYLKKCGLGTFDAYYCSEYLRAMETAGHLELVDSHWESEFLLREQDMGILAGKSSMQREEEYSHELDRRERDKFFYSAPGGESIASCALRIEKWLQNLRETASGFRVIVVAHGNIMKAIRLRLEKMTTREWSKFSDDPHYLTYNGQILHYTRRNPITGKISNNINWFRTICPWDESKTPTDWVRFERPIWSSEQLLEWCDKTERLVNNTPDEEEEVLSTS